MARRSKMPTRNKQKDDTLNRVKYKINALMQNVVHATVDITFESMDIIEALYDPATVQLLRAAHEWVAEAETPCYVTYRMSTSTTIRLDGNKMSVLLPNPARALSLTTLENVPNLHGKAPDILLQCREVERIVHDFAMVHYAANWLIENATPGAIRYYWPSMLALAGDKADQFPVELPSNYHEPKGIHSLIPMLRATAGIVAGALMLGDVPAPENQQMLIDVEAQSITRHGIHFAVEGKCMYITKAA